MQLLRSGHGRAADYKLGRLSPDEEIEFQRHLIGCEECAQTLRLLEDAQAGQLRRDPGRSEKSSVPRRSVIAIALIAVIAAFGYKLVAHGKSTVYLHGSTSFRGAGVALQIRGQASELLGARLPAPMAGDRYELYVLGRGSSRPAPTGRYLALDSEGDGGVSVPQGISGLAAVALYSVPVNGASSGPAQSSRVAIRVAAVKVPAKY